ncbi:PseH, pseudaminic acid biosynthesis N-acetyl transferase [Methylophilaceae bacterium]|jgi:RimJ/RimL family protein N-acetyltransferase
MTEQISISKAFKVVGKTLSFRNACLKDADFILSLRTNPKKSQYLSLVSNDLAEQQAWLIRYEKTKDQAYFIIEKQGEKIGTVRLYDPQDVSFCWGSWILIDGCHPNAAMESALMVYAYAIDYLGFNSAHFDVRKENMRVWKFHERFGAIRVKETDLDYLYRVELPLIQAARQRYEKFLPEGVKVIF